MSTEFEVGGKKYKVGRLDAMTQFHVLRRLGTVLPTLKGLIPALPVLMGEGGDVAAAAEALGPMAEAIAAMSDADSEYILGTCLSIVHREQPGGGWAPVWSAHAKRPMFDDIGMVQMLQIVFQVVTSSLRPF